MPFTENFYTKAKLVLPTLITLPISINLFIIFLRWIDDTYLHSNFIEEESWSLHVPLLLIPIALWFFLVPKIRLFHFPKGQRTGVFGYSLLIYIWLIFVCGFTQTYYTNVPDTITELQQVEQINKSPQSRYYRIQEGNLARAATRAYVNYYTSSKGGTLNMDIYFTIPIFSPGKFNPWINQYWYGVKFHKTMKNRVAAIIKDSTAKHFFIACREELNTYTIARAPYLIWSPNSKMNRLFMKAIQSRNGIDRNVPIILIHPAKENFAKRNDGLVLGLFLSFIIGLLVTLIHAFSEKTALITESQQSTEPQR